MTENSLMLSMVLFVLALAAALVAAAWHRRSRGWRRLAGHCVALLVMLGAILAAPSVAVVEKLLTRLIMPVGLLWLSGYAAAWYFLLGGRWRAAAGALTVWLFFSAVGNDWFGNALFRWLEADFPPVAAEQRFDAVLVLGGGTALTSWNEPQLSHAGDRLRVGARLYSRGQTQYLIGSGTSIAGLDQAGVRDLAAEAAQLWSEMGVPYAAIIQLPGPHNTSTEIAALAELIAERGWRRVGLVTSAWHLRRAMRLARRAGLAVTPIPADVRGRTPPPSAVAVVPTGASLYGVQLAVKELLGALLGR